METQGRGVIRRGLTIDYRGSDRKKSLDAYGITGLKIGSKSGYIRVKKKQCILTHFFKYVELINNLHQFPPLVMHVVHERRKELRHSTGEFQHNPLSARFRCIIVRINFHLKASQCGRIAGYSTDVATWAEICLTLISIYEE